MPMPERISVLKQNLVFDFRITEFELKLNLIVQENTTKLATST